MNATKRQLLEGIIDYAGIFPPAQLASADAIHEYFNILKSPDAWIVSNLAWSVARLDELADLLATTQAQTVHVAAIARGSADRAAWDADRAADSEDLNRFLASTEGRASIESYECRVFDPSQVAALTKELGGFNLAELFIELPADQPIQDALAELAELELANAKLRLGGQFVPSAATLAEFLWNCASLELPFKLTAGLHHAVFAKSGEAVSHHGFLNCLYAVGAALEFDATPKELLRILETSDVDAFSFDQGFAWHDEVLPSEAIDDARALFLSFGSCSVAEPLEDLAKLN